MTSSGPPVLRVLTAAAGLLAATVLSVAPAHAAEGRISDPRGDRAGRGLDIVSAAVENGRRELVARVHFVDAERGDVIVSVDQRRGTGVRLVSEYRPDGETRSYVVAGAFTDTGRVDDVRCRDFRARWSPKRDLVRMVMPASCLDRGRYDDVRFAVLTERRRDTDYAPGRPLRTSDWIARRGA